MTTLLLPRLILNSKAGQRMHIDEVYALILVVLAMAYLLLTAIRLVTRLLGVRLEMSAF